jgi:hypothetical protein
MAILAVVVNGPKTVSLNVVVVQLIGEEVVQMPVGLR